MTKENQFSKIPPSFVYCTNVNCGRRDSCLRHLALSHAPESQRAISILNPAVACGGDECEEYLSSQPIMMAYGWGKLYDGIDYKTAQTIKSELQRHFGRLNYYRYGRRERALTPQDQDYIKRLFTQHGVAKEPEFEYHESQLVWR